MSTKLAEKEDYEELTDKQKSIVDAYVENPNARQVDIADIAGADDSYVYHVLQNYGHIADERLHSSLNGREEEGEVSTEAPSFEDLFSDLEEQSESETQHITERPVRETNSESEIEEPEVFSGSFMFSVELTQKELKDFLMSDISEGSVGEEIVDRVVSVLFQGS